MSTPNAQTHEPERPKRLTLTQIVEQLLQRGSSEHSSVTLTRNAKGDTALEVIVRTNEHGPVTTIEEAEAAAVTVYDRLRSRYPYGDAAAAPEAGR